METVISLATLTFLEHTSQAESRVLFRVRDDQRMNSKERRPGGGTWLPDSARRPLHLPGGRDTPLQLSRPRSLPCEMGRGRFARSASRGRERALHTRKPSHAGYCRALCHCSPGPVSQGSNRKGASRISPREHQRQVVCHPRSWPERQQTLPDLTRRSGERCEAGHLEGPGCHPGGLSFQGAARRGAPGHPASVCSVHTCLHPVSLGAGTVSPACQVAERGRYREGKRQLLRAVASLGSCPLRPGTPRAQEKASCFRS